jgi:DNA-binding transcriptional LysR family regulator
MSDHRALQIESSQPAAFGHALFLSPRWPGPAYYRRVEIRQLEAFVAVATELHFGRAAEKLHIGQPTLSELIQRLERELGTPLLRRTTRRVSLTTAGSELLRRATVILDDVAAAGAAVRRLAEGDAGMVRVGVTPPVAPILARHLDAAMRAHAPDVEVEVRRMWLFQLERAIVDDEVDVAITCGLVPDPPGVVSEVFCGEPLMVSVRFGHRYAERDAVTLADLADETLGVPSEALFPAWTLAQRQLLEGAGVSYRTVEIGDNQVSASKWPSEPDIDFIFTVASLVDPDMAAAALPLTPTLYVPFMLQWAPDRVRNAAVARFVRVALMSEVPSGWVSLTGNLREDQRPVGH